MAKKQDQELANGITHATAVDWYELYVDCTTEKNNRAIRDREYLDGIQWKSEEIEVLKDRNQPVVTINRIQPKINYILGHEIRTRVDPQALPVTPQHEDSKNAVTDALRHAEENTEFDYIRSFGTEDLLAQGSTGVVVGYDPDEGCVTTVRVPWRQIWFDPRSLEPDYSDARYRGVANWWDLDDALEDEQYGATPESRQVLEQSIAQSTAYDATNQDTPQIWFDRKNRRVKILEVYWQQLDPETKKREWFQAHFTHSGWLIPPQRVHLINDKGRTFCPLRLTSCYVVQEGESAGERYGIIRNMVSAQDEINHRRSRALHLLNSYGVIYEEGAVANISAFLTQLAKADCAAKVEQGAIGEQRFMLRENHDIEQGHLQLYQDAKLEIDATGPSAPVVAGDQSVLSGRAILAKQSIGSMELERPFDNVRRWQKNIYKCWWYIIRQFWTAEKWLRVTDSSRKEGYRFVAINRAMTRAQRWQELVQDEGVPPDVAIRSVGLNPVDADLVFAQSQEYAKQAVGQQVEQEAQMVIGQLQQAGQQVDPQQAQQLIMQRQEQLMQQAFPAVLMQHPLMQQQIKHNEIEQLGMDIVIDVAPDTTIAAQEEFLELIDLASKGTFNAPTPLQKALIKASNLRSKDEILQSLDQPPDPAAVQAQQKQVELMLANMAASVQNLQAEMQLTVAKIAKTVAETQIAIPAQAEKDKAAAMREAATAGSHTVPTGGFQQ